MLWIMVGVQCIFIECIDNLSFKKQEATCKSFFQNFLDLLLSWSFLVTIGCFPSPFLSVGRVSTSSRPPMPNRLCLNRSSFKAQCPSRKYHSQKRTCFRILGRYKVWSLSPFAFAQTLPFRQRSSWVHLSTLDRDRLIASWPCNNRKPPGQCGIFPVIIGLE